ncbi:UBC-like protein [Periconia macrospinosa]|uniref:UBC-like protein n=1 Tax=Periconia macrospinosa TaxID=97972 RepID=A0A2V1DE72_9PLEO|nr:UBC-like protein [Periconia macrospinosa]
MNSKSLRRLAADHGSLQTAGLPPNYLFPPTGVSDPYSDLTSLDILLAGPIGTPYASGVWRLHLDIPTTYPAAPPTATFRTPLWHPNIDEKSGAVCVETLKRDWSSSLKLRDVLVTISCLLIQPNPASALNEDAGKLASEDWDSFCRRATLMTKIHAAIPSNLLDQVMEAQNRGEEKDGKKDVMETEAKVNSKEKGKAVAKNTPNASKLLSASRVEDEENLGSTRTVVESDPESDWIPGPIESTKALSTGLSNIFGIQGLNESVQLDVSRGISSSGGKGRPKDLQQHLVDGDPFITVSSKSGAQQSFSLRLPTSKTLNSSKILSTDTPELLKFSHRNPFSAIQPNNQIHPLIREFSWSWEESEAMSSSSIKQDTTRKRFAGDDFQAKQRWESKRFKRAKYDLKRYNRGDFGPRTGVARL